ncbi:MAG: hypothetical protein ORN23_02375 [Chthoniobacterales bacterium]|nr:hypothetical protein [Chthoniobacterales bacterium]
MKSTRRALKILPLLGILLLLAGCLYDNPPTGPSRSIDTWLVGQWQTKAKAGHPYSAVVAPTTASDHYRVTFSRPGSNTQEFDGWISRVDGFSILVLKSLDGSGTRGTGVDGGTGKYLLCHYELLAPGTPPPGGIGAERIRLSELQLDESTRTLDSFKLRAAIRTALKEGTLLAPFDTVAERKGKLESIPGSLIWTKTGSVTLEGETF